MVGSFRKERIALIALAAFYAAGCGGGGNGGASGNGGGDGGGDGGAAAGGVDPSMAGSLSGSVSFEGSAPDMATIDMSAEADCAARHETPPKELTVVVNDNATLANVFVYVKEGLEDRSFPTPEDKVVIDQVGCRYMPHVSGVQKGQTLSFKNSDGLLHNVKAVPSVNRGFNISQPMNMETDREFRMVEVMIPIECNVHGWMKSYVGVLDHPYFAVSNTMGEFKIDMLPPGDYVIEAWHERYGTSTANVTIVTGETAEVSFSFSEAMAENAVVPLGDPIDPHDHATEGAHAPPRGDAGSARATKAAPKGGPADAR